jgi:hypothetical protein
MAEHDQQHHDEAVGGRPQRPAPRPRSERERELGFVLQGPVSWFSPPVMADAALRLVLTAVFGAYLDKRELQAALPARILTHHAQKDELWFDFTADTGDGFNATHSVAWLLAKRQLEAEGLDRPLPRGDLLVLGGDEVYPTANAEAYEDRFVGPFTSALPWSRGEWPDIYAIPGNHDWFDGLTAFMRIFCQQKTVGGWETWQSRSYFAVQLPHNWWLWGLDVEFDTYIDDPQLRYFDAVPLQPGDRVILCCPQPKWVDVPGDEEEYNNLAYVERKLILPKGGRLEATLSGDLHHYARYSAEDGTHKFTAGGGGAFLHQTHDLPDEVELEVDDDRPELTKRYRLERCYPDKRTSKFLALRSPLLPFKNVSFMWVAGLLHAVLLLTMLLSPRPLDDRDVVTVDVLQEYGFGDLVIAMFGHPTAVMIVLLFFGAMFGFAKPPPCEPRYRPWFRLGMGTIHAAMHLAAVVGVVWLAIHLVGPFTEGPAFAIALFAVVVPIGGFLAGVVLGVYLIGANLFPFMRTHGNEAFSGVRFTRYKNFLRLHIDREGVLTIYPLGIDRVSKAWELDPDSEDPEASWFRPAGTIPRPRLIDDVIRVGEPAAETDQASAAGAAPQDESDVEVSTS